MIAGEIGLQIEKVPGYRPEPAIAVIDADYEHERYAACFYGIVEVLSATDLARHASTGRTAIDDKLAFYRSHASTEFILVVSQYRIEIKDDVLDLPRIGTVCSIATIYKGVKLDPGHG